MAGGNAGTVPGWCFAGTTSPGYAGCNGIALDTFGAGPECPKGLVRLAGRSMGRIDPIAPAANSTPAASRKHGALPDLSTTSAVRAVGSIGNVPVRARRGPRELDGKLRRPCYRCFRSVDAQSLETLTSAHARSGRCPECAKRRPSSRAESQHGHIQSRRSNQRSYVALAVFGRLEPHLHRRSGLTELL